MEVQSWLLLPQVVFCQQSLNVFHPAAESSTMCFAVLHLLTSLYVLSSKHSVTVVEHHLLSQCHIIFPTEEMCSTASLAFLVWFGLIPKTLNILKYHFPTLLLRRIAFWFISNTRSHSHMSAQSLLSSDSQAISILSTETEKRLSSSKHI